MKKLVGFVLCGVLFAAAGLMAMLNISTDQKTRKSYAAAQSSLIVSYSSSDGVGPVNINTGVSEQVVQFPAYKIENSNYGAVYGTTGTFLCNIAAPLTAQNDWLDVFYKKDLSDSWTQIPDNEIRYEAGTDPSIGYTHALEIDFDAVRMYKITIKTKDGDTPHSNSFIFVCRSGDINLSASFDRNGGTSVSFPNTRTSPITISVRHSNSFYEGAPIEVSSLVVKDTDGNDVREAFEELFEILHKGKGFELKIKPGVQLVNTTYKLSFTVTYTKTDITQEGVSTDTEHGPRAFELTLTFDDPPKIDWGWGTFLLGLLLLGVLGGGVYGCSVLVQRSQAGHERRLDRAMAERAEMEKAHLAQLRSQMEKEQEQQRVEEKPKQKTAPKKRKATAKAKAGK